MESNVVMTCARRPAGGGSGRVCVWAVRGARRGPQLAHARAAAAAFLPRRVRAAPRRLLVLTADGLHVRFTTLRTNPPSYTLLSVSFFFVTFILFWRFKLIYKLLCHPYLRINIIETMY